MAKGRPARGPEYEDLAREVTDGVGLLLSSLIAQLRLAIAAGQAGPAELLDLETGARKALDGARTLAYGLRNIGSLKPE